MTIQPPPDEEIPRTPPTNEPEDMPIDTPLEPGQEAPGPDEPPAGLPRDEPDIELG